MATYNRADLIEESLNSVLAQTRPPDQVVVIDDGSEDDTGRVVARFGGRVTYLRKENGGKASALNIGLPLLTGDYVWIFDDDDLALPDSLAKLAAMLDKDRELGFVYSNHLLGDTDAHGKIVQKRLLRQKRVPPDRVFVQVMKGYFFAQQGMLVRRRCYDVVGPFNETMLRAPDYEMMVRLARRCRCASIEEPTFILRRHESARGPKALRHEGDDAQRARVHMEYDGRIGLMIRRDVPLAEFIHRSPDTAALSPQEERTALLTRMSIMAGKGLLAEMVQDLEAACAIPVSDSDAQSRLTSEERALCEESMHYGYFWRRLPDCSSEFMRGLRRCSSTSIARQAIRQFAKGMFVHAKSYGDPVPERVRRLSYFCRFALLTLGF